MAGQRKKRAANGKPGSECAQAMVAITAAEAVSDEEQRSRDHVRTEVTQLMVAMGLASGWPHERIAKSLGICTQTLKKHYVDVIDLGKDRQELAISGGVLRRALNGDQRASEFLLMGRFGWAKRLDVNASLVVSKVVFDADFGPGPEAPAAAQREREPVGARAA